MRCEKEKRDGIYHKDHAYVIVRSVFFQEGLSRNATHRGRRGEARLLTTVSIVLIL